MPLYLPPEQKPNCRSCSASNKTRLCAACGEVAYCSPECQKSDWKRHKSECGITEKIDLGTFYPFLAILVDFGHQIAQKPDHAGLNHPALMHQIINDVNPGAPFTEFANGWEGIPVELGDPIPRMGKILDTKDWWPKAKNMHELNKLRARITRENHVLPILFGLCVALVDILYTSTFNKEQGTSRTRLYYRQAPIVDFGIYCGSVRVVPEDKLAYLLPDGTCIRGQDPNDHYWIYFLTSRGEEFMLDCSMFTFNLEKEVVNAPYLEPECLEQFPSSPAFTEDRALRSMALKQLPSLSDCARKRFSVLRHPTVLQAFSNPELFGGGTFLYLMDLYPLMDEISGRECSFPEQEFFVSYVGFCSNRLYQHIMRTQDWKSYPKDVMLQYDLDADGKDPIVEGKKTWEKLKKEEKKEKRKEAKDKRKTERHSSSMVE
ncbi:hypothetical protein SCHPADRAFT_837803 [Schizopora paradoxa]|uniref:MYND-type domain-containing protein n=1 Tax=Schizopora paradoxa TaxID=27342 RepID=A0A0H2RAW0_9AGAM|nr:hypothetical protein SCHPADRAFT_837803 [Schizopora paradoxa]